jgi:uncharacterized membrane protein YidH (DUF202 family)
VVLLWQNTNAEESLVNNNFCHLLIYVSIALCITSIVMLLIEFSFVKFRLPLDTWIHACTYERTSLLVLSIIIYILPVHLLSVMRWSDLERAAGS